MRTTRLFLDGYTETLADPRWRLPEALRGRTDDEIIADMEYALLHGPRQRPGEGITPEELKNLFNEIDKAPVKAENILMTQRDLDDILAWGMKKP